MLILVIFLACACFLLLLRHFHIIQEERAAYLKIAADKGDVLLSTLQDFFELARLEADDSVLELQRFNLMEIVHEAILGFILNSSKPELRPQWISLGSLFLLEETLPTCTAS